jgi:hypothetical protein
VIKKYQKMAQKIKINLSNGQKKSSDEQFLKGSQNWESSSALTITTSLHQVLPAILNNF